MTNSAVVICTRNRPNDLARGLASIAVSGYAGRVVVFDASDDSRAEAVRAVCSSAGIPRIEHVKAPRKGLARQRNDAVAHLDGSHDIVHFLDDDTRIEPAYFDAIERLFFQRADVAGIGGVVVNQPPSRFRRLKSVFLLDSKQRGRVLRSGRNTIGHYPSDAPSPWQVDWLPGCCMSYRLNYIAGIRFDDRLEGYSWGEDFDFSYRLGRQFPLLITPDARCMHEVSSVNRVAARQLTAERLRILYRWVHENRESGLSPLAFWWSVIGEVVLRAPYALRDGESRSIVGGIWDLARASRRGRK